MTFGGVLAGKGPIGQENLTYGNGKYFREWEFAGNFCR
jgi:hypothetical protein